jgi:hypothetical protein
MLDKLLDVLAAIFYYGGFISPLITFPIIWIKKTSYNNFKKVLLGIALSIAIALIMLFIGFLLFYRKGYQN